MKILFVINQLDCGGAEQQMVALCEGLRLRNFDVEVISIYEQLELEPRLTAIGIPVVVAHKYGKLDLTIVWRLRRLILKSRADLIHAYLPASSLFTGMAKWTGIATPLIQSERSVNSWRCRWRIWLDRIVRWRVEAITCNADAIRKHLIEREHVPTQKIAVIYNGLARHRRQRPPQDAIDAARNSIGASRDSFIVICVANFVKEKQHDVMLYAFAEAKKTADNLFLVLVGKGEREPRVRLLIEQLRLANSTQIIRGCTNPLPLLCASDAAILASSVEGCSNALLEAMAAGLPIVATDTGGNKELVTDGRGGIMCPVGNTHKLCEGILRLWREPILRAGMKAYNIARVQEDFTDNVMVERTLTLYQKVLSASPFPSAFAKSEVTAAIPK
jgi:glycosyltransferase involved in cell wall biosynthesis